MKKHLFLILVAMVMLGWSSAQAQDVVEVNASATQVTQDFDGMWDATAGKATLQMPQGWARMQLSVSLSKESKSGT
jgi:hypothetical protein